MLMKHCRFTCQDQNLKSWPQSHPPLLLSLFLLHLFHSIYLFLHLAHLTALSQEHKFIRHHHTCRDWQTVDSCYSCTMSFAPILTPKSCKNSYKFGMFVRLGNYFIYLFIFIGCRCSIAVPKTDSLTRKTFTSSMNMLESYDQNRHVHVSRLFFS